MDISWKIIETYFRDNPEFMVKHHLQSYNSFFFDKLPQIFKENNPIRLREKENEKSADWKYQCDLYLGGKKKIKSIMGNLLFMSQMIICISCTLMKHVYEI